MMVFYSVLAVATLFGFGGLGFISLAFLFTTWVLTRKKISESFPESHRFWVIKTAELGIAAHGILVAILLGKVALVVGNGGDGWLSAMIGHWFLDHIGEALISIWLAYRSLKGAANLHQGKSPEFPGTASEPR